MQADKGAAACRFALPFGSNDETFGDAGIGRKGAVGNLLIGDGDDGNVAVCRCPEFSHFAPAGAGDGVGG